MKRINSSYNLWPSSTHVFNRPHTQFSEQEVIDLSSAFLTPGVHYIKVESMSQGRALMSTFLKTLNFYHDVAYVGTHPLSKSEFVKPCIDVCATLKLEKPIIPISEFLSTHLYCDFLWIEATNNLMTSYWFDEFEQSLFDLKFDKVMPVVFLTYE